VRCRKQQIPAKLKLLILCCPSTGREFILKMQLVILRSSSTGRDGSF
jgi:hypothetical protein